MPAGTELCTLGAEALAEGADAAAEGERGVAVVKVSAVVGVERREGAVVKARARAGVRRERQRVQIMVVGSLVRVVGVCTYCGCQWLAGSYGSSRCRRS